MKLPGHNKQNFSSSERNQIIIAVILLGIAALVIVVLLSLWLPKASQQQPAQAAPTLPSTSIAPTIFVPTPDCGPPTLVLGATTFQIQTITRAPDGSLTVLPDTPGIAYWVQGTDINRVFVLSPAPENLALVSSLTTESTATATGKNCNSTTHTLSTPQQGSLNALTLPDQTTEGITIFVQADSSGNGYLLRGELTEEQISTFNTPSGTEIQAEISLLETTASADGATVRIGVSIQNYGSSPFILTVNDALLTSPGGTPQASLKSEPSLPREIGAGALETFQITFPRPASPTAVLNILGTEYDIEGY